MVKQRTKAKNSILLAAVLITVQAKAHTYLKQVLTIPALRTEFAGFLDTILKQIPSAEFYALIDKHKLCERALTDKAVYKKLLEHKNKFRPTVPLYRQLKSLYDQKIELARQAKQLLRHTHTIDGYVEIGSPGTYKLPLSKFLTITGTSTSAIDKKRWSDLVQTFNASSPLSSLKPCSSSITLNNYAEITPDALASASVDLVVCFVGLHHVPHYKLDKFIASIQRILRPGGIFLLREHDCKDQTRKALIYAAHSIYNIVISQVSEEAEAQEYRNFQPLDYWEALLEKHGFSVDTERLIQQGDPTLNTLFKCTKVACAEQDKITYIAHNLQYTPGYKRDLMQTYLSSPEWLNVDAAQEYGMFIEHTPFYEFPYFQSIAAYWDIFRKSWYAAAQKNGILKATLSPYTLMNTFIGATMTLEYAAKGAIAAPIRWLYAGQEATKIKALVKDPKNQLDHLDNAITVCKNYPGTTLKLVELPRSKEFLRVLLKICETDVNLLEIAGQKQIQVKIRYKNNSLSTIPEKCVKEYQWTLPTQPDYIYCALTVEISELKNVIQKLQLLGCEILYIHDY